MASVTISNISNNSTITLGSPCIIVGTYNPNAIVPLFKRILNAFFPIRTFDAPKITLTFKLAAIEGRGKQFSFDATNVNDTTKTFYATLPTGAELPQAGKYDIYASIAGVEVPAVVVTNVTVGSAVFVKTPLPTFAGESLDEPPPVPKRYRPDGTHSMPRTSHLTNFKSEFYACAVPGSTPTDTTWYVLDDFAGSGQCNVVDSSHWNLRHLHRLKRRYHKFIVVHVLTFEIDNLQNYIISDIYSVKPDDLPDDD